MGLPSVVHYFLTITSCIYGIVWHLTPLKTIDLYPGFLSTIIVCLIQEENNEKMTK